MRPTSLASPFVDVLMRGPTTTRKKITTPRPFVDIKFVQEQQTPTVKELIQAYNMGRPYKQSFEDMKLGFHGKSNQDFYGPNSDIERLQSQGNAIIRIDELNPEQQPAQQFVDSAKSQKELSRLLKFKERLQSLDLDDKTRDKMEDVLLQRYTEYLVKYPTMTDENGQEIDSSMYLLNLFKPQERDDGEAVNINASQAGGQTVSRDELFNQRVAELMKTQRNVRTGKKERVQDIIEGYETLEDANRMFTDTERRDRDDKISEKKREVNERKLMKEQEKMVNLEREIARNKGKRQQKRGLEALSKTDEEREQDVKRAEMKRAKILEKQLEQQKEKRERQLMRDQEIKTDLVRANDGQKSLDEEMELAFEADRKYQELQQLAKDIKEAESRGEIDATYYNEYYTMAEQYYKIERKLGKPTNKIGIPSLSNYGRGDNVVLIKTIKNQVEMKTGKKPPKVRSVSKKSSAKKTSFKQPLKSSIKKSGPITPMRPIVYDDEDE